MIATRGAQSWVTWALLMGTPWTVMADEPAPLTGAAPPVSAQPASPLSVAVNEAGFELLYAQPPEKQDENLIFSPLSIVASISMLEAGAGGKTAAELMAATRFAGQSSELATAWSRLLGEVASPEEDFTLRYAAQLWGATDYDYQPRLLQTLRENYQAELFQLDFRREPDQAQHEINRWLREQTGGRIELGSAPPITSDTTLLMTTALYFRGYWTYPFPPQLTEDAPFQTKQKESKLPIQVPLMRQIARLRYAEDAGRQLVELPYRGERITLVVVLPNSTARPSDQSQSPELSQSPKPTPSLPATLPPPQALPPPERWLTAADFRQLRSNAQPRNVEIFLPRFQTDGDGSLKETLYRLGVQTAFGPEADFTPIAGKSNLYLQDIRHQALIDLNESGTEVAAVTTAFIAKGVPTAEVVFRADRPFLFFVVDDLTHAILLMGRFAKPS